MTQRALWLASVSHYRRHPLQLIALLLIIVLATALWSGVWDLTRQARQSLQQGSDLVAGLNEIQRQDGRAPTVNDFVRLRRAGICVLPWLEVVPVNEAGRVIGVDGLSLGCFRRVGAAGSTLSMDDGAFVEIGEAAPLAEKPEATSTLRLMTLANPGPLLSAYRVSPAERRLDTGELADSFLLNLDALCVLVLLITGLLVRSVYVLGVSQRQAGFLLLRRFGVSSRRLRRFQIAELALIAVVGAMPGACLGLILAQVFARGFGHVMSGLFDVGLLASSFSWMAFVPVLVMTGLVLLWSLLDRPRGRGHVGWLGWTVGVVSFLIGAGGLIMASGLVSVFVCLALMFLGSGLLTPPLLTKGLAWLSVRSRRPLRRWSLRELSVMVRRLGLPVVALQFAAATVIAIQALVTTFETTFYDWLDQRLQGDVYLELADSRDITSVAPVLDRLDGVGSWHAVRRDRAQLTTPKRATIDLLALNPESRLLRHWTFLKSERSPWKAVENGDVMINEQLARRFNLSPGDTVAYVVDGHRLGARVAAIYADYGRPSGEILMNADLLPGSFVPTFVSLTVALAPGQSPREFKTRIGTTLPQMAIQFRDNETVRGLAQRVFQQTFLLTRAVSVLTLVLAGISLLVLGWVFFGTRQWYFHLLRVWGLRRSALHWRISGLSVAITGLACLSALPLGVLMTWALVARLNPLAFGWSLPMAIYPVFWLELIGVALVIGLVIAWLIQRQLNDRPPQPVTAGQVQGAER